MRSVLLLSHIFIQLTTWESYSIAQDGVRGGDTGLDHRILVAQSLAIEAVKAVTVDDLSKSTARTRDFYRLHRESLLNELEHAKISVKRAEDVKAPVNGVVQRVKAITDFKPGSEIWLSDEENLKTPLSELTAILLHEVGHHTGHRDENETTPIQNERLLLNRVAHAILEAAKAKLPTYAIRLMGGQEFQITRNKQFYSFIGYSRNRGKEWVVTIDLSRNEVYYFISEENLVTYFYPKQEYESDWDYRKRAMKTALTNSIARVILGKRRYQLHDKTSNQLVAFHIASAPLSDEDIAQLLAGQSTHFTIRLNRTDRSSKTAYQLTVHYDEKDKPILAYVIPIQNNKPIWRKGYHFPNQGE